MPTRFPQLAKTLPLFLLAAACATQVPDGLTDPAETSVSKRPAAPIASQVAPGQSAKRLAMPVAATEAENAALLSQNPGVQQFLAGDGKGWKVVFDRRSGQPMYFEGPGIAWMPGRGNTLTAKDAYGNNYLTMGGSKAKTLAVRADTMTRALLAKHTGMLGLAASALVRDDNWTGSADDQDTLYFATFRHAPNGTQQKEARVTFVINNGNLVQIHSEKMLPGVTGAARLTVDEAFARLRKAAKLAEEPLHLTNDLSEVALTVGTESSGTYEGPVGQGYQTHLAYTFRFQLPNDTRTLAGSVDAQTGELLDLWDDNKYGHAEGGIYKRTVTEPSETIVPFESLQTSAGTTDLGGNFSGTTGTSTIAGTYFNISDDCGAPSATAASGTLSLGTSAAHDCSFSSVGHSTRAARNAFYHLEHVRQMIKKHLTGVNASSISWAGTDVGVNVNINQSCNAYWDGSTVNFFQSDATCSNTGEIMDVMDHEYGHGFDQNSKSGSVGDPGKGEAFSDTTALLFSHDKCVGPGFFKTSGNGETTACDSAVRDFTFLVTAANIATKCQKYAGCAGALGYECHCESHILSGATWDLAQALVAKYGQQEGWATMERLWMRAAPMITAYMPNVSGNAYSALLAADDDNGNVTDGTPNADLINTAFAAHGLANTTQPPVKVVACPSRPASPTVTATGGTMKADLSWTATSGATSYSIFRRLTTIMNPFLPVGTATGTTFTDTQVAGGFSYDYVVVATAGACTSAYGNPVSASITTGTPPPATNDFGISAPASAGVQQTKTATVAVATALTSGSAQTIALSVAGLPAGVTGAFSPASVSAGASSTLTLTASATATVGAATLTITGTATSGSHTASVALTVTASGTPPPPPPAAGPLANGDFESGLTSWTATGKTSAGTSGANTGAGLAVVGSATPYAGTSTLTQAFVVPATGASTLSFAHRQHNPGNDTLTYANQTAELRDAAGKTLIQFFRAVGNATAWTTVTQDLSAYQGQTLTLYFSATDDGYASDPVWFDVDTVSVTTATPDTQAPTATITAPAASTTVSGTVNVTATATDNVGVVGIELFVDGASLGTSASSPASASWNTTTVTDGSHALTAKATDAAGNIGTSAAVSVTVKNATTPPPAGQLIQNGGFEGSLTNWTIAGPTGSRPLASAVVAHTGTTSGRMGWMSGTTVSAGDSYVYQWVTIPATATKATLTYYTYGFTEDFVAYDWQEGLIYKADGKTVLKTLFHTADNTQTWKKRTADLSSLKGQTIAVMFNVHSDGDTLRTTLWVDDVTLNVQ